MAILNRVIVEERGDEIVLKPAPAAQVDYYNDEQVAQWDREDRFTEPSDTRAVNPRRRSGIGKTGSRNGAATESLKQ